MKTYTLTETQMQAVIAYLTDIAILSKRDERAYSPEIRSVICTDDANRVREILPRALSLLRSIPASDDKGVTKDEIAKFAAKEIAGARYDNHEKPLGNSQSRDEYMYYMWDHWIDEADAVIRALSAAGLLRVREVE